MSRSATESRALDVLPAMRWLRGYQRRWLRVDLIAGLTLSAYLLPAALGDASLAGLPPERGLYACLFSGWFSGCSVARGTPRSPSRPQYRC